MNVLQQLMEAVKQAITVMEIDTPNSDVLDLCYKALHDGEAELRREPVGFLFQHSETGRTRVVMRDGVMDADATWFKVGPLYLGEIK